MGASETRAISNERLSTEVVEPELNECEVVMISNPFQMLTLKG
ncbi:hypothetical protein VCRA2120E57_10047 [Vibrio crassostreae]|nr:hypothetical protein VCRA2120E57_10047 [Vibrio crassostreae]